MKKYTKDSKVTIIGAGRLGGSLALALVNASYNVKSIFSRNFNSSVNLSRKINNCFPSESIQKAVDNADVVFITTPDDAISKTATSIKWVEGQAVIHCSGVSGIELFKDIEAPIELGSFHPMQTFASINEGSKSMEGITFAIDGTKEIIEYLKGLSHSLNANFVLIPSENKAMYHLTGTLMGNLLLEYVAISAKLWEHIGYDQKKGIQALVPMMRQVADNLENIGLPEALAGPYIRGDIGTIKKHLEVLKRNEPQLVNLYCSIALAGFPFAEEKGTMSLQLRQEIKKMLESEFKTGD